MSNTFDHGYALLIGVGESRCADLSLPVTVQDMKALYRVLTDAHLCAYPANDEHVRLLHDSTATRQDILDELEWF